MAAKEDDIRKMTGNKIRNYRRQKNMSVEDLANKIYKSKSSVSKYELGSVNIDIDTLSDIAKALDVPIYKLVFFPETIQSSKNLPKNQNMDHAYDNRELYIYYYDGRKRRVIKSYLKTIYDSADEKFYAYYYLGLKSYEDYNDCDFVYEGTMLPYDLVTYYNLVNQVNTVDRLTICALKPLHQNTHTYGILIALLANPIAPYVTKVIISTKMIRDEDIVKKEMMVTKEEINRFKHINLFFLNNEK